MIKRCFVEVDLAHAESSPFERGKTHEGARLNLSVVIVEIKAGNDNWALNGVEVKKRLDTRVLWVSTLSFNGYMRALLSCPSTVDMHALIRAALAGGMTNLQFEGALRQSP